MIRKLSRQLNKGNTIRSFSIVIAALISTAMLALLPVLLLKLAEVSSYLLNGFNPLIKNLIAISGFLLVTFAAVCIYSSFSMGEKAWYTGKLTKKKNSGKRLRFWFSPLNSFKALRLETILFLLKLFWTIVLLSPSALIFSAAVATAYTGGIEITLLMALVGGGTLLLIAGLIFRFIILQRYFLAPYLMASDPKLKSILAVKQSKNLLEGHIFRIVTFKLKFIPYFLLYPLVIPIFFLHPYYKQSCSVIAKEICL